MLIVRAGLGDLIRKQRNFSVREPTKRNSAWQPPSTVLILNCDLLHAYLK
jgi:hypothetical protein